MYVKTALTLYTIGAFGSWLIVGNLADTWDKAHTIGAIVALLGVLCLLVDLLFARVSLLESLALSAVPASIPFGILVTRQPISWVMFWIAVAGFVLSLVFAALRRD